MGGGGQANSGQASTAAAQQTAANNQDMALSKQYGGQEQAIFNRLFGSGASGGGTLSGMMDPKSLNTGTPTGAYQTAWNNSQNQIAQNYAQQKGSLAQSWANSGMGSNNTPSGFQADQQRKLGSSEADSRGSTYTGIVGQQHSDALNNFWNANNIAAGQQASATGGSNAGAGNAGSSSSAIYGTAGQYHPSQAGQIIGSALGAAGQVGAGMMTGGGSTAASAAMCAAEGSMVRMADGSRKLVEELAKGDQLLGADSKPDELTADPQPSVQEICEVNTAKGKVTVSLTHAFVRDSGGYAIAAASLGEYVETDEGSAPILGVRMAGERRVCFHLFLKRSHGYNVDGFWSLE